MDNAANEKPEQEEPETTHGEQPAAEAAETTAALGAEKAVDEKSGETAGAATGDSTVDSTGGVDIGSQAAEPALRMPRTIRGKIEPDGTAVSTGRRKTAVARVRLRKGSGKVTINDRAFEDYFPVERHRLMIEAPLKATGVFGQVDIWVRATGGGVNGQAGAVILGVARAIQALHPEQHGALSDGGFLTRDDRMVERKKYGHRKARRSFQFSKR
jgi:small subunit ribosomal protein S9